MGKYISEATKVEERLWFVTDNAMCILAGNANKEKPTSILSHGDQGTEALDCSRNMDRLILAAIDLVGKSICFIIAAWNKAESVGHVSVFDKCP